jgi:hypothetical protein
MNEWNESEWNFDSAMPKIYGLKVGYCEGDICGRRERDKHAWRYK